MKAIQSSGLCAGILDILDARRAEIILALMDGTQRFGQLRAQMRISQKTLSANLHALESAGLLTRKAYAEVPLRVEYTLTERGYSLRGILDELAKWNGEHLLLKN